jgi:hypothetical protein
MPVFTSPAEEIFTSYPSGAFDFNVAICHGNL